MNEADVEDAVVCWQNVVICCVLGANPPYEVIARYVRRIWSDFAIDKVLLIKKGLSLVRFNEHLAAVIVTQKGAYYFDQKPFIVKAWTFEMEINIDGIASLPL